VDGSTSSTLWTAIHPYEDLPKVIDPPTGFVQNTNDAPWTSTYPTQLRPADFPPYTHGGRPEMWRTTRSLRMLTESPKLSFDDLVERKHSTRLEFADRVLDELLAAIASDQRPLVREAAAVLKDWDRQTEAGSRGALLFELIAPKLQFTTPLDPLKPLDTPKGLRQSPEALAGIVDAAAAQALKLYGTLDAKWGDWRRLVRGALDSPANGGPGSLGAFRVFNFGPAGSAKRNALMGDTFYCLVEFGNPVRARALTVYGNSSQPGSPHGADQLPLAAAKQTRAVLLDRKAVEAHLESKDEFR
jgi:acyl-homoserine-lactone acylase